MKAHPTDAAPAMLPLAKAHGQASDWRVPQKSDLETTDALRSRLLQMIVANEQSRVQEQSYKSQVNHSDGATRCGG